MLCTLCWLDARLLSLGPRISAGYLYQVTQDSHCSSSTEFHVMNKVPEHIYNKGVHDPQSQARADVTAIAHFCNLT